MAATKIKCMCTINVNVVWVHSYEKFSIVIWKLHNTKFPDLWYSNDIIITI